MEAYKRHNVISSTFFPDYAPNDTFDILFHTDSTLNDYGFLLDFDIKKGIISSTPKPSVTPPSGMRSNVSVNMIKLNDFKTFTPYLR